jgi:hypothetical protein
MNRDERSYGQILEDRIWAGDEHYVEQPEIVNLDTATGFTFSAERGTFIGGVQMLKWLVEHHSEDYWKAKAGETK